jgi:hypothetical protein
MLTEGQKALSALSEPLISCRDGAKKIGHFPFFPGFRFASSSTKIIAR